jgi:hypothetical protein
MVVKAAWLNNATSAGNSRLGKQKSLNDASPVLEWKSFGYPAESLVARKTCRPTVQPRPEITVNKILNA